MPGLLVRGWSRSRVGRRALLGWCILAMVSQLAGGCLDKSVPQVQDVASSNENVGFDASDSWGDFPELRLETFTDGDELDVGPEAPDHSICKPDCDKKECGDDGCGGNCGHCSHDDRCNPAGKCLEDD